ncbi:glycoside hydrolase family 2 [Lachnoclostridium sp. An169]|uniref:glycoside hydrolase family 2 TIM barrel-domain containing protein n=1 Tax=Lachnoclostridium sp. An169 TaxID=1965569 RepID=UPI000B36A7AA|nr:glycoside hydrolase family 2 TIM barrel-domain containing protein [Lachnoclostridium sp. An169]OUP82923.1 glycoside hydrolase family 2 [Lachnoclostridium sp. An169]
MRREDFNTGWKYRNVNDRQWREITLPHDAMLFEKRREDAPGTNAVGYFEGGRYIYEKTFLIPKEWEGDYLAVEFEGVYQHAKVYLNDTLVKVCEYGYIPFRAELMGAAVYGEKNVIRVEADNSDQPNSRWYSGSGIYRPVHLIHAGSTHIDWQGVRIKTLSYEPAKIQIRTSVTAETEVKIILHVTEAGSDTVIAKAEGTEAEIEIPGAKLWDEEHPHLYRCRVLLMENDTVLDEAEEEFGIRLVEWTEKGLFINGKETLLKGACVHHDNGVLGAATYDKSEERRVRLLKKYGFNAIRSSHNPAAEGMLRACDKLGVYVMDETWDMWYGHKNKYDYADAFMENYHSDINAMVERDYNHPSVIMYSIGNEVSEPKDEKGVQLGREIVEYVHKADDTRPVTAGINLMVIDMASRGKGVYKEEGGRSDQEKAKKRKAKKTKASGSLFFNMMTSMIGTNMNKMANSRHADEVTSPILDALDIAGYNYASGRYPLEEKAHPGRLIIGTETFPMDIARNWEMVKKYPYLLGDFMWTGWDYLGEAGIGAWTYTADGASFDKPYPWLLADVGALDILGDANGEAYYAKTVWGLSDKPYIGVRPVNHPGIRVRTATWRGTNCFASWSWSGCTGNKAEIEVYADAARIELLLNGKSLGKKKVKAYKTLFRAKYRPGKLEAVAYDASGRETGRNTLVSAREDLRVSVLPEEEKVKAGDIIYIPVCITDQNGIVESNMDKKISVSVEGGTLLGFGSARPCTLESFVTGEYTTYCGRALAVVKAGEGDKVRVYVQAEDLGSAEHWIDIVQ